MKFTSDYDPERHDSWGWSLAKDGKTRAEIAEAMGVSVRTIQRWEKEHQSFKEAVDTGREEADSKVEKCLYKRALGYDSVEEEKIVETDKDGNIKPVRIRSVKKHIPPDTMAIMYWLNNRSRKTGKWSQKQEVEISGTLHEADLSKLSDEELSALAKLAADGDSADEESK